MPKHPRRSPSTDYVIGPTMEFTLPGDAAASAGPARRIFQNRPLVEPGHPVPLAEMAARFEVVWYAVGIYRIVILGVFSMRQLEKGSVLHVRAIAGSYVVTLAWDFADGHDDKRTGLLGFAIERSELKNGNVIERYYLRGIKRFKFKDEGLAPGTPMPTSEHPVQSFQWGDYTAKPATTYRFKVTPVYGKPKLLQLDEASSTTVEITTEAEEAGGAGHGVARHNIYFNRGAAGSQAFARKFGEVELDEDNPKQDAMVWLSRGLFEALTDFIGLAAKDDASDYKLRAMLYEFRYLPVGQAFKAAADAGADV